MQRYIQCQSSLNLLWHSITELSVPVFHPESAFGLSLATFKVKLVHLSLLYKFIKLVMMITQFFNEYHSWQLTPHNKRFYGCTYKKITIYFRLA